MGASAAAELRAVLAVARKDLRVWVRYPVNAAGQTFSPIYQTLVPAILFGGAFFVDGRAVGLESSAGTADLAGFIVLGAVVSGMVSAAFWGMAWSLRVEMDSGTLEPAWLTPTPPHMFVLGRALGALGVFAISETVLVAIALWLFRPSFSIDAVQALPAVAIAAVSLLGVGYLLTAAVMFMRDAGFFIDTTNFLFASATGVMFPVTALPGIFQAVAYILPTTYALDLLRHRAIGSRPLTEPLLEVALLVVIAALSYPLGRWVFARAERRMRIRGTLSQH
jgi:ABC-2 type transport system permease protein